MKNLTITHVENALHPWTMEPGWELLLLQVLDEARLDGILGSAEEKGWDVWCYGQSNDGTSRAVLYRPKGAGQTWSDPSPWPEPERKDD